MVPEKVRNVALVGHGGSGKTTLAEALLFVGGATSRQGAVEQGTTVLDHEPEEIDRGISLSLSVATLDWSGHRINLIDTPGSSDFSGDARAALRAADLALFVVSGVDGVEVQTEQLWKAAGEEGIPRAVVVSKLDRERASFERTIDQLRNSFGKAIAPLHVPIGEETSFRGLIRVATERAYEYTGAKKGSAIDLPDEVENRVHQAHTALVETVVETDDDMMEAYFEGNEPTREQIIKTIHHGILEGDIEPVGDLIVHRRCHADAADIGEPFNARRDVHSVAENVVVLENDVAQINADTELDLAIPGDIAVASRHSLLNFDGAAHRVGDTLKLDQHPVACGLDDVAVVLGNAGIDQLDAMGPEPRQRPHLVNLH